MEIKITFYGPAQEAEFLLRGAMSPRWAQRKACELVKVMGEGSSAVGVDEKTGDKIVVVKMGQSARGGGK